MEKNTKKEVTNVANEVAEIAVKPANHVVEEVLVNEMPIEIFDDLKVTRDPYEGKDRHGKKQVYHSYFVVGKIRNRDVKVNLIPTDVGGYETLDLVFFDKNTASLARVPYELKDQKTGKVTGKGYTYQAIDIDPDTGMVYKMQIKPKAKSDSANLEMIIALKFMAQASTNKAS